MNRIISTLTLVGTLALAACGAPTSLTGATAQGPPTVHVHAATSGAELVDANLIHAEQRANDSLRMQPLAVGVGGTHTESSNHALALESEVSGLSTENAELQRKVRELQWLLNKERSASSSLEAQVNAMGGDAQAIQRELADKDAMLADKDALLAEKMATIAQIQQGMEQTRSTAAQAEQENRQMHAMLVQVQQQLLTAERDLSAQDGALHTLEREMVHLQRRAEAGRTARQELLAAQGEIDRLRNRLRNQREMRERIHGLEAQVNRLKGRLAQAQAQAPTQGPGEAVVATPDARPDRPARGAARGNRDG